MSRKFGIVLVLLIAALATLIFVSLREPAPLTAPAPVPESLVPTEAQRRESVVVEADPAAASSVRESIGTVAAPHEDEDMFVPERPEGSIAGKVVDDTGAPIAKFVLQPRLAGESADAHVFRVGFTDLPAEDPEGAFEPGTYTLRAPDGYWRDQPPQRTPHGGAVMSSLEIASGPIGAVTLRLSQEGHVSVRVIDADGTRIGGAHLQAFDPSMTARFAQSEMRTEADGSFVMHSLAPDTYTLEARKDEKRGSSPPTRVEAGKTASVEIRLQ